MNLRISCAKVVQNIFENKAFLGDFKKSFDEKDLSFANMLILTSLRNWCGLECLLSSFLNKKIPHKHCLAKYLLILALNEILFMNTAPYAVINATVGNIKKNCDKFLGGMANAVLRKVLPKKEQYKNDVMQVLPFPEKFLPVLAGYSVAEIKQIAASLRQIPSLDITVKDSPIKWQQKLKADLMPNGTLRLYNQSKVYDLPGYAEGSWWVQDCAASLAVVSIGKLEGLKVLDLCAAPGGKTAQLLALGANVTALDISESRLNILKQNMARLGFNNVHIICDDALHFLQTSKEKFDVVLLDAPCSASGTFRRHPEILHIKRIEDVYAQKKLQNNLLCNCHKVLKNDGILLYSVCSINKMEGEYQIEEFLSANKNFQLVPIRHQDISRYGEWSQGMILPNGTLRTLPFYENKKNGIDSFFICKMQRII